MGHEVIDLRGSGKDDRVENDNFQSCLLKAQPGLRFGTGDVNGKRAFKDAMLLFELGLVGFVDAGNGGGDALLGEVVINVGVKG